MPFDVWSRYPISLWPPQTVSQKSSPNPCQPFSFYHSHSSSFKSFSTKSKKHEKNPRKSNVFLFFVLSVTFYSNSWNRSVGPKENLLFLLVYGICTLWYWSNRYFMGKSGIQIFVWLFLWNRTVFTTLKGNDVSLKVNFLHFTAAFTTAKKD